jgi:hypothetical protein
MREAPWSAVARHRLPPLPHTTIAPKLGVTHALELSQSAENLARWYEDTKGKGGVEPPHSKVLRTAIFMTAGRHSRRGSGPQKEVTSDPHRRGAETLRKGSLFSILRASATQR